MVQDINYQIYLNQFYVYKMKNKELNVQLNIFLLDN